MDGLCITKRNAQMYSADERTIALGCRLWDDSRHCANDKEKRGGQRMEREKKEAPTGTALKYSWLLSLLSTEESHILGSSCHWTNEYQG